MTNAQVDGTVRTASERMDHERAIRNIEKVQREYLLLKYKSVTTLHICLQLALASPPQLFPKLRYCHASFGFSLLDARGLENQIRLKKKDAPLWLLSCFLDSPKTDQG